MTTAMQTEPEQWAVELWNRAADAADGCATQSFGDDAKAAALTIQRAFEERERKLREALKEITELHGEINPCNYDHDDACELNRQFCYALTVADQALKE